MMGRSSGWIRSTGWEPRLTSPGTRAARAFDCHSRRPSGSSSKVESATASRTASARCRSWRSCTTTSWPSAVEADAQLDPSVRAGQVGHHRGGLARGQRRRQRVAARLLDEVADRGCRSARRAGRSSRRTADGLAARTCPRRTTSAARGSSASSRGSSGTEGNPFRGFPGQAGWHYPLGEASAPDRRSLSRSDPNRVGRTSTMGRTTDSAPISSAESARVDQLSSTAAADVIPSAANSWATTPGVTGWAVASTISAESPDGRLTDVHVGDVDAGGPQEGADGADDPGAVVVAHHQHVAGGRDVDGVVVDHDDPGLAPQARRACRPARGRRRAR